jgi:hypothetical protein
VAIRRWVEAIYVCHIRKSADRRAKPYQIASPGGGLAIARRLRRCSRGKSLPLEVFCRALPGGACAP